MNQADDNPYSPPTVVDDWSTSKPSAYGLRTVILTGLQFVSGLVLAFCVFWFFAAVYEIVMLKDAAYGPHTWRFRSSYIWAAITFFAIGSLSLFALVWIRRRLRVHA